LTASFTTPQAEWSEPTKWQNWAKNQYVLSGLVELLDAEGEWFLDTAHNLLYFRPPANTAVSGVGGGGGDGGAAGKELTDGSCPPPPVDGSVEVKTRSLGFEVKKVAGHCPVTVHLHNLVLKGATVGFDCCNNCNLQNISLEYPTYNREIAEMNVPANSVVKTQVVGDNNTLTNISLTMSNNAGLSVSGNGSIIHDVLIDKTDWLGTFFDEVL
jgi:hypothetical protein